MKKVLVRFLSFFLKVKPYMMKKVLRKFTDDFKNEKRTNFGQKIWAYRRGFTSSKIIEYGLDNDNFQNYLSDLDYSRLFPLNNKYAFWINDKLTTKYILQKYNKYMPEYYFNLNNGVVSSSLDMLSSHMHNPNSVLKLLKEKEILAIKQVAGSLGIGFYKVEFKGEKFLVNNESISESELIKLINSLDGYLVSEYIKNNDFINNIFSEVTNCVRLQVIKDKGKPAFIANAFMRFGTSKTKGVDSPSAGAVFSIVNINDGSFGDGKMVINNELFKVLKHPDTNIAVEGILPNWDIISKKVLEIADYIGQLSWMGFDVVITNNSFKILEINSHQAIERYQYYYPLLKNNPASEFFYKNLKNRKLI